MATETAYGAKSQRPAPRDLRALLTNHNPFYVVSAALVLWGVHRGIVAEDGGMGARLILGILVAYSLALGGAAVLIVRLGRVWEDARTVLLLMVLLFLAASVLFDELLLADPRTGRMLLGMCLVTAVVVSEVVVRALPLRLPVLYRLPYHAALVLFHAYPVWISQLLPDFAPGHRAPLALAIAGFPVAAGAIFVAFAPALRRGRDYVAGNGTPWSWPWYPLPLLFILAVAALLRSYLLCRSLYPAPGAWTPFGSYMLSPLLLAFAVLCLVASRAGSLPRLHQLAHVLPVVAIVCALPRGTGNRAYVEVLTEVVAAAAAPGWLTCLAAAALYGVSWSRGAKLAELGVVLALGAAAVLGPQVVHPAELLQGPHPLPLCALAAIEVMRLVLRPNAARCLLALGCGIAGLWTLFPDTWFTALHGAAPLHAIVLGSLAIGHAFRDPLAAMLRVAALFALVFLFALVLFAGDGVIGTVPIPARALYLVLSLTLVAILGFASRSLLYRIGAAVQIVMVIVLVVWRIELPTGLAAVLCGGVSLVVGVAVSLAKGRARARSLALSARGGALGGLAVPPPPPP